MEPYNNNELWGLIRDYMQDNARHPTQWSSGTIDPAEDANTTTIPTNAVVDAARYDSPTIPFWERFEEVMRYNCNTSEELTEFIRELSARIVKYQEENNIYFQEKDSTLIAAAKTIHDHCNTAGNCHACVLDSTGVCTGEEPYDWQLNNIPMED